MTLLVQAGLPDRLRNSILDKWNVMTMKCYTSLGVIVCHSEERRNSSETIGMYMELH